MIDRPQSGFPVVDDTGRPSRTWMLWFMSVWNTIKKEASPTFANLTLTGDMTVAGYIGGGEKSADPADPAEGRYVIWQSDGTGSGDDGDIMIKVSAGGATKTATLVDFSAV